MKIQYNGIKDGTAHGRVSLVTVEWETGEGVGFTLYTLREDGASYAQDSENGQLVGEPYAVDNNSSEGNLLHPGRFLFPERGHPEIEIPIL